MVRILFVYTLLVSTILGCKHRQGEPDTDLKVIGGEVADANEFPAAVFIPGCSATGIGTRFLLTAAHCVLDDRYELIDHYFPGKRFNARYGTVLKTAKRFEVKTVKTHVHPSYFKHKNEAKVDYSKFVDIAIIALDSLPTDIGTAIIDNDPIIQGDQILFTGYGCEQLPAHLDIGDSMGDVVANEDDEALYDQFRLKYKKVDVDGFEGTTFSIGNKRENFLLPNTSDVFGGCPGDSGSAGYRDQGKEQYTTIIGVNSFISPFRSYLMRVDRKAEFDVANWINGVVSGNP
jgi:hypothetical protein